MSRNRFLTILQYLYFHNADKQVPRHGKLEYNKVHKNQELSDIVDNKFQTMIDIKTLECKVPIDKTMVKFKGKKIGFKQRMPEKPTKVGIKLLTLSGACNGYIGKLEIYKGAEHGQPQEVDESAQPSELLEEKVVLKLTEHLSNKGYHVCMDNFYKSTVLLHNFYKKSIKKSSFQHHGEYKWLSKGKMVATTWLDNKPCHFLSIQHRENPPFSEPTDPGKLKSMIAPPCLSDYQVHGGC